MRKSVLVALALMAGIMPALAGDRSTSNMAAFRARNTGTSVETLYNECTGNNFGLRTFCAGYISAMMDSMGMIGGVVAPKTFGICPKVSMNAEAAMQAFKNWAQKHPKAWSLDRAYGVMWALKETWPCQ